MLGRNVRNTGCRVSDEWTYRGLRTLVLENDALRVVVLLDQGSDILSLEYKPLGLDFLWKNPNGGVLSPALHIPSRNLGEGNFADFYQGGWQECFPNGGRFCEYRGTELGLHGEVYGLPWSCEILEDGPEAVTARLTVRTRRTPFLLVKTLRLTRDAACLEIEESLTNESRYEMEFMWGHHPAFGEPFLSSACVVTTGARRAHVSENDDPESRFAPGTEGPLPMLRSREGRPIDVLAIPGQPVPVSDMLYLTDLEEGFYAITNTDLGVGFGFEFDPELFRYIWYWIACNAPKGAPFFGRSYTVALEPFTSWPAILSNAIARGTAALIGPETTITTRLKAGVFRSECPPCSQAEIDYSLGGDS
jgi:galactose mutarotase-like enzyme